MSDHTLAYVLSAIYLAVLAALLAGQLGDGPQYSRRENVCGWAAIFCLCAAVALTVGAVYR